MNSIYDLIDAKFGVDTTENENPLVNEVEDVDTIIAPRNPTRVGLIVVNLSPVVMYIRPRNPAAAATGIRLNANGGSISMSIEDDFTLPSAEWHAIALAVNSDVYVLEILITPKRAGV